ncbi:MAG TPA: FAD-binding oxidoreductase [bacterium]|nr:FAD-binding oxidoreductase [bacterium]HOM26868.1 FAD-binding oxidoreductase [bacterium]
MKIKENFDEIISYLEDSSNFRKGKADKVYIPETENEIFEILEICRKERVPITVSGGGTGTVAGRIPVSGYIISTESFNKIIDINKEKKIATLQAGVIVDNFLKEIEKEGLFYPPFPTERTAFIGGNVSTNASGEYSFKFGPTRKYVKRIKMVLTSCDIIEIKRGEIFEKDGFIDYGIFKVPLPSYRTPDVKCSAGYYSKDGMDGIDLIIGSEGTLGIITEVDVSLIENLPPRFIMILFLKDEENIPEIVREIKERKDELEIFSFEFFDKKSLLFLKDDFNFIPEDTCAIYIEATNDTEKMEKWIEIAEKIGVLDTVIGEDITNYKKLIDFRHKLPENVNAYFKKIGSIKIAVDAAVPEDKFENFYRFYRKIMEENKDIHTILFGHIGENHLHFNLFPVDEKQKERAYKIYEESVKKAVYLGGTGFAEHGIGKLKHKYLEIMYGRDGILDMVKIKKIFDPYCILGLDNIFPKEYLSLV